MNSSAAPDDPAARGDTYQYPYRPPVDSDGKPILDIPWKFFDSGRAPAADRSRGHPQERQRLGET